MVRLVSASAVDRARAFLEAHRDTSVFLLYCLERFGPALGPHRDSGNFFIVEQRGEVVAVTASIRRGHLLLETGGRADLGDAILDGLAGDPSRIDGVVAEWRAAQSVWPRLSARPGFVPTPLDRHTVLATNLGDAADEADADLQQGIVVRGLTSGDFDAWYPLFSALEDQEGAHIHGPRDEVRARFASAPWRWWGAFVEAQLAAVACLDVSVSGVGHVGGIYVHPDHRRKGLARAVLNAVVADGRRSRHLSRLVLLTRDENHSARRLYEGLGFGAVGHFGFLLGSWSENGRG